MATTKKLVGFTKKNSDGKLDYKQIWKKKPEKHDYPAAADYLDLLFNKGKVKRIVRLLKKCKIVHKKAKDILRASRLPLLPRDNRHVMDNINKVKNGEKLSPVLLVRHRRLLIADGYHRVCAIYYLSEDFTVPCKLK